MHHVSVRVFVRIDDRTPIDLTAATDTNANPYTVAKGLVEGLGISIGHELDGQEDKSLRAD